MARKTSETNTTPEPLLFGFNQSTRLIVVLLGATLLLGALLAPWWTRGMDIDEEKLYADDGGDNDGDSAFAFLSFPPGSEGLYFNYGPFHTPSSNGISYDAGREAAVAVLGISLVGCLVFCTTSAVVRLLMAARRIETSYDAPVRLAIVAFILGTFAVLWGAFFVPLAGDNPGMLYGDEPSHDAFAGSNGIAEDTRYANVGFFLGIIGAVGFPAYLWFDAARVRALNNYGWGTDDPAATLTV